MLEISEKTLILGGIAKVVVRLVVLFLEDVVSDALTRLQRLADNHFFVVLARPLELYDWWLLGIDVRFFIVIRLDFVKRVL